MYRLLFIVTLLMFAITSFGQIERKKKVQYMSVEEAEAFLGHIVKGRCKENSSASRAETERWILDKLNKYIRHSTYQNNFTAYRTFYFEGDYLILKEEHKYRNTGYSEYKFPIYYLSEIYIYKGETVFKTKGDEIIRLNSNSNSSVTDFHYLPFDYDAEPKLIDRLKNAFCRLKDFYIKPVNKEIF
jgi:hypothetical protein